MNCYGKNNIPTWGNSNCNLNLSLPSIAKNEFRVISNPASGFLELEFPTSVHLSDSRVELYSVQGKQVGSWQTEPNTARQIFNIDHLPAGLYILKFVGYGEVLKSEKVIIR